MAFIWGDYRFLDLHVYMGAAHEFLLGRDPYHYAFTFVHLYATYPPVALILLSPLSLVPIGVLVYLWSVFSLLCLAWLCFMVLAEVRPPFQDAERGPRKYAFAVLMALGCAILLEPVRSNFGFGQVDLLLVVLLTTDILRRGRRSRGVLVGLASAVKLTPLIFVVLLVLERDWRAVRRSLITFVTATGAAWLLAPSASAEYFFHFSVVAQRIGAPSYVSNQSLNGIIARLGLPGPVSTALWLVAALALFGLAAWIANKLLRPGHTTLSALIIMAVAGLLISPVSWDHAWSWAALFPFALLDETVPRPVKVTLLLVILIAVTAPYWWSGTSTSYGIHVGFLNPVAQDSLAAAGVALIGVWAWSLRKEPALGSRTGRVAQMRSPFLLADGSNNGGPGNGSSHVKAPGRARARPAVASSERVFAGERPEKGARDGEERRVLRGPSLWTDRRGAR